MKGRIAIFFLMLTLVLPFARSEQSNENQMLELINAERMEIGLSPLIWNDRLAFVAAHHAQDMLEKKFFSHVSNDGLSPWKRVLKVGYYDGYRGFMFVAENIEAHSGNINVVLTHANLMRSPGHRRNMLSRQANEIGIGFASKEFLVKGFTIRITVCVQVFAYHSR